MSFFAEDSCDGGVDITESERERIEAGVDIADIAESERDAVDIGVAIADA